MTLCAGRCGNEGAGHFDSGRPAVDRCHSWCDSCWSDLYNKRMPAGLKDDADRILRKRWPYGMPVTWSLPAPSGPELNAAPRAEHKIMDDAAAKSVATVAAAPVTDSGTFTGYLASFERDLGGDTITGPSAVSDSVAALNAGRIQWHLTDAHSERASDIVATVTAAAADRHGVRIDASWAPTPRAQQLRAMVRNGQKLGLSIDYYAASAHPDGRGGRNLEKVLIVGGAITPKPMNPLAVIFEGKSGSHAAVVAWCGEAHIQVRPDAQREAEDRLLEACDWPPRDWPRETRLAILNDVAAAKSRRLAEVSPQAEADRLRRERWEWDNVYCSALARTMATCKPLR